MRAMQALRIGPWTLWPGAARLERDGRQQDLTPQQLALLLALARAPQRTLGKAALFEQVRPGKVVGDDALNRRGTRAAPCGRRRGRSERCRYSLSVLRVSFGSAAIAASVNG